MCTETFLRLPGEKRDRFLDAAWEEFTRVSFSEASINQIVRRAGVPRGSFYQYFADKADLFAYLMEMVQDHFVEQYWRIITQADGDVFQAQVLCFERFAHRADEEDILFDRCLRVLRLNPGLHLQMMAENQPGCPAVRAVWSRLDRSVLRGRDETLGQEVFALSLMVLASAVMDSLADPENLEKYREKMMIRLDIIKQGSLAKTSRESA